MECMRNMAKNVLVTGAGGYIGRYVVKSLLDLGCRVTAVDFKLDDIDSRAQSVKVDILNQHEGLFADTGSPDVMIHMAWQDGFTHNADSHIQNLSSHYRFVMAMIAQGLKQVVVMGSMHEVGYVEGEISDDTPTNPMSLYGTAKNALRRALTLRLKDSDVVLQWIRAFYILGDDARNASVFTRIIETAKAGKKTFPFATGMNEYDFIRIETLGEQIAKTACQRDIAGIINCCSGQPRRLKDVVEEFIASNGFDITLEYGAFPDRPYDSPIVYGNTDKINRIMADYPN